MLDTNVLLDMAIPDRPTHRESVQLLMEIEAGQAQPYVCATSLKDVYYILGKFMEEPDARAYINALLAAFSICEINSAICKTAIKSDEPDFEDGLVRATAEFFGVDYIISRDERAFGRSSIKRLSPDEYIELIGGWEEIELNCE